MCILKGGGFHSYFHFLPLFSFQVLKDVFFKLLNGFSSSNDDLTSSLNDDDIL
jgi:hypothetical protein